MTNPTMRNDAKRKPGRPKGLPKTGGGSRKGVPNKITQEFRETVRLLLEDNRENVARWLQLTADGDGKHVKPDPGRAVSLLAQLAEFAAPKLARTEHVGDGGGALVVKIVKPDA